MKISGILESCLYAENLDDAEAFYSKLPGIEFVSKEEGRHVFFRCGSTMLLIFNPAHTSTHQTEVDGNKIPLHGSTGVGHIAFAIQKGKLTEWKNFFHQNRISIESEITWPNGSVSLYFRDPAGNSLELVNTDIWK